MSPFTLGLAVAALVAVGVLVVHEWVRILVAGYRVAARAFGSEGTPPHTPPIAADGGSCHPKGAKRPPQGVDHSRSGGYVCSLATATLPLAEAMQPDFESFFGGFQAVIEGAGICVIAVGMVVIARRYLRP